MTTDHVTPLQGPSGGPGISRCPASSPAALARLPSSGTWCGAARQPASSCMQVRCTLPLTLRVGCNASLDMQLSLLHLTAAVYGSSAMLLTHFGTLVMLSLSVCWCRCSDQPHGRCPTWRHSAGHSRQHLLSQALSRARASGLPSRSRRCQQQLCRLRLHRQAGSSSR